GNAWFSGSTATQGNQLFKLGFDGSVTQWTAVNNLNPHAPFDNEGFTTFHDALWFTGNAPGQGEQLYKLGNDGSVAKWTGFTTGGGGWNPAELFVFDDALWFSGQMPLKANSCSSWERMAV